MADEEIQPNERFTDELRAIYRADVRVPAHVDDAVMNRARAHFARPRWSRGLALRIGALVTAAAAVIVVGVFLAKPQAAKHATQVAVAPEKDVKPKGAVDIVDALQVARRIRERQTDLGRDDFNRDGAVNQRDVDAIAMSAVQLGGAQ